MEEKTNITLEEIIFGNNKSGLSEMQTQLNELKKTIIDEPEYIVKNAIIDFFLIINPFSIKWEEELKDISNYFIKYYSGMIKAEKMKFIFIGLKNPLLKFLIQIDDFFPKEKEEVKLAFKIILLTQDKKTIINYIKSYLISSKEEIENEINKINFNNPFAIIFMHSLFNVIFSKKNKTKNILDKINNKMKKVQTFRCNQCFDLLYIIHINNITSLICNNASHTIEKCEKIEDLEKLNNYDLICCECGTKLKLYYENYKCIICKKFVCFNCRNNHYKSCPPSELIDLFNVGYICEKHNKKIIDTCELCNKNLCEECKSLHYHIIKEELHVKLEENVIADSLKKIDSKETKYYIGYHLFKRYKYMQIFHLNNVKINKALYFLIFNEEIQFKASKFFSSQFFDDEFKKYYNKILEGAKKGKDEEIECMKILENEYQLAKVIFPMKEKYYQFKQLCLENQKERKEELNDFYPFISNLLLSCEKLYEKTITEFNLQSEINKHNIDILLLKNKIKRYNKSDKLDKYFMKKLLSRYFADYIIKILIKNYPKKFKPIKLTLLNIYEIILYYGIDIISDDKLAQIKELIENILSKENNLNEYLINYLQNIKEENLVIFNESIKSKDYTIEKDELNFVLASLLYLKKIGNIVAHPNIESSFNYDISKVSENIKKVQKSITKNKIIISDIDNNNSLINLDLKKSVKDELNLFKDEILDDLKDISFRRNAEVEYILNYIFKNETSNIKKEDISCLRVITNDIQKIINDENDFNEEDLLKDNKISSYYNVLNNLEENERSINDMILSFKDYEIKINTRVESEIKSEMKSEMKKRSVLDYSTFVLLIKNYKKYLPKNLTLDEKKAYIISIFAKEYLENSIFSQKKIKLKNAIREIIKYFVIEKKFSRIHNLVEKAYEEDKTYFNEASFLNGIKNYIKEIKFDDFENLSKKEISLKRIIEILKLLIKEKNIDWLVLSREKTASISSYLYFMQNKRG